MSSSVISSTALVSDDLHIGELCVIEDDVVIGSGCVIGHHVVIRQGSIIGDNVRIDDFACIGKHPMKAVNSAVTKDDITLEPSEIGDESIIGTGAVIYCGAKISQGVLIADLACVRENVTIGVKTIIGKGATIENECSVGSMVKIQTNAYITAYSTIEDDCFIAPCAVTSNDNYAGRGSRRFNEFKGITMKRGSRLGAGTVVLPAKTIQEEGFVGAGAVVTHDVSARTVVVGNPARKLCDVSQEQLLKNQ